MVEKELMPSLKAIRNLTLEELRLEMLQRKEPGFRAKQVYEWIWKKSVRSPERNEGLVGRQLFLTMCRNG